MRIRPVNRKFVRYHVEELEDWTIAGGSWERGYVYVDSNWRLVAFSTGGDDYFLIED